MKFVFRVLFVILTLGCSESAHAWCDVTGKWDLFIEGEKLGLPSTLKKMVDPRGQSSDNSIGIDHYLVDGSVLRGKAEISDWNNKLQLRAEVVLYDFKNTYLQAELNFRCNEASGHIYTRFLGSPRIRTLKMVKQSKLK